MQLLLAEKVRECARARIAGFAMEANHEVLMGVASEGLLRRLEDEE